MSEIKYYPTTPAQNVILLQLKYTLFKRVCNILSSVTLEDEKADWKLMKKACNLTVMRNDCLRIRFVKGKRGQVKQYFAEKAEYDTIPVLSFATQKEQEDWIKKTSKKAIDFMHGHVADPVFINTWDGKSMVFIKVCHCILDAYGINVIYNDLMGVYFALKNNTELPPAPGSFEELVKKDLASEQRNFAKDEEYLREYLNRPMPYYAGIHGSHSEIWNERVKKGIHSMKMFFLKNDTECAMLKIDPLLVSKAVSWCAEQGKSVASFFLYTFQVACSLINRRTESILSLELCNCRGTALEKKTAGTKVQSIMRYTYVSYDRTFSENFDRFTADEAQLYRHVGFPDTKAEQILHSMYKFGIMDTLYNCTFSLIPVKKIPGVKFEMYSNGKFIIPAYVALVYDIESNSIDMLYDYQTKLTTAEDVNAFHAKYVEVIKTVLDNPGINLGQLK